MESSDELGGLAWRGLEPFGVEVDFDLREPLNDKQIRALTQLFHRDGLVVLRNQELTVEQQIGVVSHLGPVIRALDGVGIISTDPAVGSLGTGELAYHSDYSFTPHPLQVLSLHAIDVRDGASSTRYVSAMRAFERLRKS